MDDLDALNTIFHGADNVEPATCRGDSLIGVGIVEDEVCAIIRYRNRNEYPVLRVCETELHSAFTNVMQKLKSSMVPMYEDLLTDCVELIQFKGPL